MMHWDELGRGGIADVAELERAVRLAGVRDRAAVRAYARTLAAPIVRVSDRWYVGGDTAADLVARSVAACVPVSTL